MKAIFVSGGTGYIGTRLIAQLLARRHSVFALARTESAAKLPVGTSTISGNALNGRDFAGKIPAGSTFVHLVGVSHPSPWKARAFREVDLAALRASTFAAREAAVSHFVFVSVAHPAPVMKAYVEVRQECEAILSQSGLRHTILRPWYVLGPGHRWPLILKPFYALGERFEATREGARRLGLVTVEEMVAALTTAAERDPRGGNEVWDVPKIRSFAGQNQATTGNVRNRGRSDGSAV